MFSMIAAQHHELIQNFSLLPFGRNLVPFLKNFNYLCPGIATDLFSHIVPPDFGNIPMRQRRGLGNKKRESRRTGKIIVAEQLKPKLKISYATLTRSLKLIPQIKL
jgi:hypothetical protein